MRRFIAVGTAVSVLLIAPIAMEATADDTQGSLTRNPSSLSDSELDARLNFLEQRLDAGETYSKYWQWGWTSGYGLGVVIGTAQAIDTDSPENRAYYIVTAAKGAIGTTRMILSRHPGRNGADPIREVSGSSREDKLERLVKGEELLQRVAERARHRTHWKAHAANVALNLIGAGFVLGFGYQDDAAKSFGIGVAVGEAQIWSAPKRGIQDLEDYQTRFDMKTGSRVDWMIVPTMGGVALRVTF